MKNKEELLEAIGLQSKRSTAESVASGAGLIALGAIIGTVAGIMLAPKSGREIRKDMRTAIPERFNAVGDPSRSVSAS